MTAGGNGASIERTSIQYVVNYSSVPYSVVLFTCACGASAVDCDVRHELPDHWSSADDGSPRCPHCAEEAEGGIDG